MSGRGRGGFGGRAGGRSPGGRGRSPGGRGGTLQLYVITSSIPRVHAGNVPQRFAQQAASCDAVPAQEHSDALLAPESLCKARFSSLMFLCLCFISWALQDVMAVGAFPSLVAGGTVAEVVAEAGAEAGAVETGAEGGAEAVEGAEEALRHDPHRPPTTACEAT